MLGENCHINDKGKTCCTPSSKETKDLRTHWDDVYANSPDEKMGWYESDLKPTIKLINATGLATTSRILNVGAGSTMLIDELLGMGYSSLVATDLSQVALNRLEMRVKQKHVEYIIDDLTQPEHLRKITPVDLWIDRAVLHFFMEEGDRQTYFDLLRSKVKMGGFVLLAEYNLDGATKCAGLPVYRYSVDMLSDMLGEDFRLVEHFDHLYHMPSGAERPYIYTLFKRI